MGADGFRGEQRGCLHRFRQPLRQGVRAFVAPGVRRAAVRAGHPIFLRHKLQPQLPDRLRVVGHGHHGIHPYVLPQPRRPPARRVATDAPAPAVGACRQWQRGHRHRHGSGPYRGSLEKFPAAHRGSVGDGGRLRHRRPAGVPLPGHPCARFLRRRRHRLVGVQAPGVFAHALCAGHHPRGAQATQEAAAPRVCRRQYVLRRGARRPAGLQLLHRHRPVEPSALRGGALQRHPHGEGPRRRGRAQVGHGCGGCGGGGALLPEIRVSAPKQRRPRQAAPGNQGDGRHNRVHRFPPLSHDSASHGDGEYLQGVFLRSRSHLR